MQQSLKLWLEKKKTDFNPEEAGRICDKILELKGGFFDACVATVYAFEKGDLNDDEFMVSLSEITGKTPDELVKTMMAEKEKSSKINPEVKPDDERNG